MDKDILDLYFEEALDIINSLDKEFKNLENDINKNSLEEIRRLMHTIKGSSRMINFEDIANLSQEVEQEIKDLDFSDITKEKIEKYYNNFIQIKKKINELKNA